MKPNLRKAGRDVPGAPVRTGDGSGGPALPTNSSLSGRGVEADRF